MVPWKYQDKIISSIEEVPEAVYGFLYIMTDINGYWYMGFDHGSDRRC